SRPLSSTKSTNSQKSAVCSNGHPEKPTPIRIFISISSSVQCGILQWRRPQRRQARATTGGDLEPRSQHVVLVHHTYGLSGGSCCAVETAWCLSRGDYRPGHRF